MELYIVENPNKWAIPEPTNTFNDTDNDINSVVDRIIERNIGAWKILSKI